MFRNLTLAQQMFFFVLAVFLILLVFPEQAVPFINQDHKCSFRLCINIFHYLDQITLVPKTNIIKMLHEIKHQIFFQHRKHLIHTSCHAEEFLYVYLDHIILIQMSTIGFRFADLQRAK